MDKQQCLPTSDEQADDYFSLDEDKSSVNGQTFNNQEDKSMTSSSITDKANQITFSWENITVQTEDTTRRTTAKGNYSRGNSVSSNSTSSGDWTSLDDETSSSSSSSRILLSDVSGFVRPGELVAIMGASGAGKSTLLNTLTFRNMTGLQVTSGQRFANGHPVTPDSLTSVSAYVQQHDMFIGTMTVREQLIFQALVRMESHLTNEYRMRRVDMVIEELGLTKCADSLIGKPGRGIKGISGGEMKRLAFASEVLTNPSLFFCDEPTSGLDSYMAQNVVQVLRSLSKQGKTILCTIHQPNSQVFSLFDRVLLMAQGRMAFLGGVRQANTFFQGVGFPCPASYNPADHYIRVLAVDVHNVESSISRIDRICDAFEQSSYGRKVREEIKSQIAHSDLTQSYSGWTDKRTATSGSPYRTDWLTELRYLTWRSVRTMAREPLITRVRYTQTVLVALILGIIYYGQDYLSQEGVVNSNGAIYVMLTNMTFQNAIAVVEVFCSELPIFLREHYNGMYRTDTYYVSKQLAELPTFIAIPTMFVFIFYYTVGLNPDFDRFLMCWVVMMLMVQVAVSFGYLISCMSPTTEVAMVVASLAVLMSFLFGGFFLNTNSIPSWLSWIKYGSWFYYTNELLLVNQWRNVTMTCDNETLFCTYETGSEIIAFFGFSEDNSLFDVLMLVGMAVAFKLLGFVILTLKIRRSK